MKSILLVFHCESSTGYAIGRLEPVLFNMALRLCDNDASRVHISYPSMSKGASPGLPAEFSQYLIFDPAETDPASFGPVVQYLIKYSIDTIFGFDQPVHRPVYKHLRKAGVKNFVSYWGAPISSLWGPIKLLLKRIDVLLHPHGPNFYIFESQGMADTAVLGRGIPAKHVAVVYLSVDTQKFYPDISHRNVVYNTFEIPTQRKIFFYSGHMERRKGVHILIDAIRRLVDDYGRKDVHLLILGNRNGEERSFLPLLEGDHSKHITFGGYREDIPLLHRGCYAGMIGSTGWDSLTCSALEMAASGLPLLVSDLPGLQETVVHGSTGYTFPNGDSAALAKLMLELMDNPATAARLGHAARQRALDEFSAQRQQEKLIAAMHKASATAD